MKRGLLIFSIILIIGILLISFVSAGLTDWFKKSFGKDDNQLTGKLVSLSGNEILESCAEEDRGYILFSKTRSFASVSNSSATLDSNWIMEIDSNGNKIMEKILGSMVSVNSLSAQQTSDGGYILCGTEKSGSGSAASVIKLDSNLNIEWDKAYGQSAGGCVDIAQESNEDYVFLKRSYVMSVVKIDSAGNVKWEKNWSGKWSNDKINSMQQTSDGNYLLTGGTYEYGGEGALFLKIDSNGEIIWQKNYFGHHDVLRSVKQTSDGGYIATGGLISLVDGKKGIWLLKTDSNGNKQWEKSFGNSFPDSAYSVQQTSDRGYVLIGLKNNAGYSFGFIVKTDSNGNTEWNKTLDSNFHWVYLIQQTSDGGYIVSAGKDLREGNIEKIGAFLIKLNSNGDLEWEKDFGGYSSDIIFDIKEICIQEEILTTPCYDSDNGIDYKIKGDTTKENKVFSDYCNDSYITEYSCFNNEIKINTIACSYLNNPLYSFSCRDGACVTGASTSHVNQTIPPSNQTNQTTNPLSNSGTSVSDSSGGGGGGSSASTSSASTGATPIITPTIQGSTESSGSSSESGSKIKINIQESKIYGGEINVISQAQLSESDGRVYASHSNGKSIEVKVTPDEALETINQEVKTKIVKEIKVMEYKEMIIYEIDSEKPVKLIALIPANMNIISKINIESGNIVNIDKPWWSFLAKED